MAEENGGDPVAELRSEFGELKQALEELRRAQTPAEKAEAKEDVADAEEDVAAAAKRAGLKPEVYRKALAEARRAQFADEHGDTIRALVNEELDRLADEAEQAEQEEEKAGKVDKPRVKRETRAAAKAAEPPPEKETAPPPPPVDSEPAHEHWSERPVTRLLG